MIQIPLTGIHLPHQNQQCGKKSSNCSPAPTDTFSDGKTEDSKERSRANLFTRAFVIWKPSEPKTHLRPEVGPCGEGDWGTKWGFHGKDLKGASQGCSLSWPLCWPTDFSQKSMGAPFSASGLSSGERQFHIFDTFQGKKEGSKENKERIKEALLLTSESPSSNARHTKVPAQSCMSPAGQEHQRINLDTNSLWLLAP